MLSVEEFVKQTIVEIIRGTVAAGEEASKLGGAVNVDRRGGATGWVSLLDGNSYYGSSIEFDLAVTEESKSMVQGDIGGSIKVFSAKSGGTSEATHSTVSRVKFAVDLIFPPGDVSKIGLSR